MANLFPPAREPSERTRLASRLREWAKLFLVLGVLCVGAAGIAILVAVSSEGDATGTALVFLVAGIAGLVTNLFWRTLCLAIAVLLEPVVP